jgi:serine/threonine-protein kinase
MSPEQIAGEPLSSRSDQFGFGVMLFELLVGRRPYDGPSPLDVMDRIRDAAPPEVGMLDADLGAIVATCLEKRPDERFETAESLQRALASARRRRDAISALDLARWVGERLEGPTEPEPRERTRTETASE